MISTEQPTAASRAQALQPEAGQPLRSLSQYLTAALQRRADGTDWRPVHVQIRKQGVTFCGTVRDARESWDGGRPFFLVDCDQLGPVWCSGNRVLLCSGDGRCTCEAKQ